MHRGKLQLTPHQHADPSHPVGLLRVRRERHRRRAADERNELPPYHSITSSAQAISEGGTTMPTAWAVARLTLSRNRVGCSTGTSAGAAPLRILSTSSAARGASSVKS